MGQCACSRNAIGINKRKYIHQERIGEGGFSYVDLVEDLSSGKFYALKRVTCHSIKNEEEARSEINFYQALHHPNLIQLEDYDVIKKTEDTSELLMVLPYYRRGTLQQEIDVRATKRDYIEEKRVLRLFRGICEGVKALHTHNPTIAHRDIKPGNVMLTEDDVPVIMDFGSMATARVEVKGHSQAIALQDLAAERCSMIFRAPELFNVESYCIVDEKVDIWSLGCLLYAMTYLESPFDKVHERGDSVALAVVGGNITYPENNRNLVVLPELMTSMLVTDAGKRPNILWIISRINELVTTLENKV